MTWPRVALRDLGKWHGGGTPSKSNANYWEGGSIPWLSPKDMGPSTISETLDHITQAAVLGSSVKLVPADSVAVVARSGILERTLPVALVPFETTLNQDMKALIPREGVDSRWVAWGLRAFEGRLLRETRKAGTTVASIEMPRFQDFRIPLPPVAEQRRIVEILEDHLSRLDAADAAIHDSQRRLNGLRERLLFEAITGARVEGRKIEPVLPPAGTNDGRLPPIPVGWAWARLADVADVVGGVTKDSKKQSSPDFVEVPYLRVANVQRAELKLDHVTTIRVAESRAHKLALQPGDVLLNEGGDRDKLARGWVWEGQIEACIHQNHVFRARIKNHLDPYFLSHTANTIGGRWAEQNGKQSVNLASISLKMIRNMPVIVPPLDQSRRVVARLHEDLDSLSRLGEELDVCERRGQTLRRSLLTAAFSGRLTGRHTDEEVIEELAQ